MRESAILTSRMTRGITILFVAALLLTSNAFGQQSYVGRYDVYAGYAYLNSPRINLAENGFHFQGGMRVRYWLSMGFDYSVATGSNVLTADMLLPSMQQQLGAQLGQLAAIGRLPAGYKVTVPVDAKTQSFTMGPQIAYRHFQAVTFFVRPNLGALQMVATPKPADPIQTGIVAGLAPSGKKTDWTYYYGVGGGLEVNVNKHLALRVQADFVHHQIFNDLLPGMNTIRFSIGPGFQWGRNVAVQ